MKTIKHRLAALEARRPLVEASPGDLPADERYKRMIAHPGKRPPANCRQITQAEAEAAYLQIMGVK